MQDMESLHVQPPWNVIQSSMRIAARSETAVENLLVIWNRSALGSPITHDPPRITFQGRVAGRSPRSPRRAPEERHTDSPG